MSNSLKPLLPLVCVFVVLGLLWKFFDVYLDRRNHPNSGLSIQNSAAQHLELIAGPRGHFRAPGQVNGVPVTFLVDTGASSVSIPGRLATRLGQSRGPRVTSSTAAGNTTAYLTSIDAVQLGGLIARDVRATIVPAMDTEFVLLGMTFLRRYDLSFRGDQLIIDAPR